MFRAITKTKTTEKLQNVNKPLSSTRTRELLLEALTDIESRKKVFSLHSLHSAGATLAANKVVNDRLFIGNGRWKSENVKNGYIENNSEILLIVTKSLGLRLPLLLCKHN